jgi:hypothetical protein
LDLRFTGCDADRTDYGRLRLKCDGTCAETRFRLSANRTSPFKSAGGGGRGRKASVQSTTGSRSMHISGSNAGYTMFRGSVKGTGYPIHSPGSPFTSPPERHRLPPHFNWALHSGILSVESTQACRWLDLLYVSSQNKHISLHLPSSTNKTIFTSTPTCLWRDCMKINPLKTKRRLPYLKTQSVPLCKHFSSRL